jgi:hypothetical protein
VRVFVSIIAAAAFVPAFASAQAKDPNASSGAEFRVGGIFVSGERASLLYSPPKGTGSLQGFDGVLRNDAIGIAVRYLEGTFAGQPDLVSADVNLLLFPHQFSLVGGYGRRGLIPGVNVPSAQRQVFAFGRAGVSTSGWIGGTGLKAEVCGAFYIPIPDSAPTSTTGALTATKMSNGMEGEASVIYSPPHLPFYIQIGYRAEVFNTATGTTTKVKNSEQVRGIRLGGGMQFGGK